MIARFDAKCRYVPPAPTLSPAARSMSEILVAAYPFAAKH